MATTFDTERIQELIGESVSTKLHLAEHCAKDIQRCGALIASAAQAGRLIMLCGNGGSAADSQHIAAELVIRFRGSVERRAIAAMSLTVDTSALTACGNDYGFDRVFARQVEAFGSEGDVLIALSTSGTSRNVIEAVNVANSLGMTTIGLLGGTGGLLHNLCTASVIVPSAVTARIQESHILIGHIWCEQIEETLFPDLF
ncbi:MAG: SIS domain-containing protein [bacterium]|nr:SIS domain-containing protein [bacterium]